jgi:hypothetical protein
MLMHTIYFRKLKGGGGKECSPRLLDILAPDLWTAEYGM